MNKKQTKKFLVIFLPIISLVVAIISIVGGVAASNKTNPVIEVIGKEGVTTGESSEETVMEEKTYTISGCTFTGTGTHLVVKSGTNYIVEECTFSGKEGQRQTDSAVVVTGGRLTMNDCTIADVSTDRDGAGLRIFGNASVVLNNSNISSCSSGGNGGAIFSSLSSGQITLIGNSSLMNNSSAYNGGAIYSYGDVYLGTETEEWIGKISGNTVRDAGGGIFIGGTASLYQYGGEISENKLTNSDVGIRAGAGVYIAGGNYSMFNSATIKNNNIVEILDDGSTKNYRAASGGGVYFNSSTGVFSIFDTASIINNSASKIYDLICEIVGD